MEDIDNKDSFNYEYKELKVYQILETDREIHHIHIPSNEINNLQRFINNNKSTKITEREITGLYEYIINYLERGFSYNVGERLKYSYENYVINFLFRLKLNVIFQWFLKCLIFLKSLKLLMKNYPCSDT